MGSLPVTGGPMIDKTPKLSVSNSLQGFDYWVNRPYISDVRRNKLKQATLLIVPYERVHNSSGPLFSSAARGLRDLFTDQHSSLVAEIAIDEDSYAELVLHGKLLDLGKVVVLVTVIRIAMNLVSNYVQKVIGGDGHDTVRFELTVVSADGTGRQMPQIFMALRESR
jgi:hypothetical protein